MTTPCQGPDPDIRPPRRPVPVHSCDTHAHVFGPPDRFPYAPQRGYTPPDNPVENYVKMLDTLGFERGVVVHGGAHGTDNSVTRHALAALWPRCRGVAVVPPSITERELAELDVEGFRGIRLSTVVKSGVDTRHFELLAPRMKELGWHILLHLDSAEELVGLAPRIRQSGVDVMIDHLGRVSGSAGVNSVPFKTLLDLLESTEHCWTKISSWYRLSSRKEQPYDDMQPLVQKVIETRADRVVWGSNWPHPMYKGRMPNDGLLLDEFMEWASEENILSQILVKNPEILYGF